ncbi:MAG: YraN family protein [Deltaproteobacteria bacterium]|nr:YraN family protein [Deltaproteobacteria bacterium]
MKDKRATLGRWGEDLAVDFLKKRGMKILERNFRCPAGEIDIIARCGKHIIFVEVKTRKSEMFGTPQEAVNLRKQRQIIRAAQWYLEQKPLNLQPRFDVLAIRAGDNQPELEHIPDAFGVC